VGIALNYNFKALAKIIYLGEFDSVFLAYGYFKYNMFLVPTTCL